MSQDTYELDGAHANRCLGKYPGGYSSTEPRRPLKALQTARTPASALRGCWLVDVRMIPR
jgi:hypothetical protein